MYFQAIRRIPVPTNDNTFKHISPFEYKLLFHVCKSNKFSFAAWSKNHWGRKHSRLKYLYSSSQFSSHCKYLVKAESRNKCTFSPFSGYLYVTNTKHTCLPTHKCLLSSTRARVEISESVPAGKPISTKRLFTCMWFGTRLLEGEVLVSNQNESESYERCFLLSFVFFMYNGNLFEY